MFANASSPVKQTQNSFEFFAWDFAFALQGLKLFPELAKLSGNKLYSFRCGAKNPAAPSDGGAKLSSSLSGHAMPPVGQL